MPAFEVLALDTATPQIRAPGASDTYTFPRAVEMPLGTANGVLYLNGSKVVSSGSALTFDGTNFTTTGSATATAFVPSAATVPTNGMYLGAANTLTWAINSGEAMRLNSSGNLGLGVTPSATVVDFKSIEVGSTGNGIYGGAGGFNNTAISSNAIISAASVGSTYARTAAAAQYRLASGTHAWFTAPSGTAGNAISFTQAMTLDSGGNLLLGQTSDAFTSANRVVLGINGATDSSITLRAGGTLQGFLLGGASQFVIGSNALPIVFQRSSGGTESMRVDANGNVVINTAAIATNATDGFLYVPTCAGTPTGTPTTYTGRSPIVVDTTNNKLYFYSGGAWRDAGP